MKQKNRILQLFSKEYSFILATPAYVWVVLFLGIPLVILIAMSFYGEGDTGWWFNVTLKHYMTLCDVMHMRIIVRSLLLAGSTAFFCLILGYPVAYYLALCTKKWRSTLLFLFTAPFWTNLIVQMYAWFFLLEQDGLINTLLMRLGIISHPLKLSYTLSSVLLVMVYCYVPFVLMPLYSTLQRLDKRLLEASRDLGATTWETFYRITLPLSLSGIKVGALLVFIPAFGEFVIPSIIGGAKEFMVGSLIVHYLFTVRDISLGAALTTVAGLILLLCSLLWYYLIPDKVKVWR